MQDIGSQLSTETGLEEIILPAISVKIRKRSQKNLEKQLFDLYVQFLEKKAGDEAHQAVRIEEICKKQSKDVETL